MIPKDIIYAPPAIAHGAGRAWRIHISSAHATGVAGWIIEAPWANDRFHSYAVTLVHLRPTPPMPAPLIVVPGATHEVVVLALSPDLPRSTALWTCQIVGIKPPNFIGQFLGPSDEDAAARVRLAVDLVCQGRLSPDIRARSAWAGLFGDNVYEHERRTDARPLT